MRAFFVRWIVTTVAVLAAAHIVPGISYRGWGVLLVASLILGLINATLKPILMLLSLPLLLATFGLFTLVINSGLLLLVGKLVHGFEVAGWWSAFWGSLVISIVSMVIKGFQSPPRETTPFRNAPLASPGKAPPSGKDRVIDV